MVTPIAPAERFRIAQELAAKVAPMWSTVIMRWEPKPEWNFKELRVKKRELHFDWNMPIEQLAAEIIHVTDHFVMGHQHRREERDPDKWKPSACMETIKRWDEAIKKAGLEWAPGTDVRDRYPEVQRNEAEKIYDQIEAEQQQQDGQPQQGSGQSRDDLGDDDGEPGDGQPGEGQPGQGQPGEGQPGQGQPGQGQPGQGQPGQAQGEAGEEGVEGACRLEQDDFDQSMLDGLDGQEGQGQEGEGAEGAEGDGEGDGDGEGEGDAQGKPGKPGPPGHKTGDQDLQRMREEAFTTLAHRLIRKLLHGRQRFDYSKRHPSNRSELTGGGVLGSLYERPEEVRIIVDVSGSVDEKTRNAVFHLCEKIQRKLADQRIEVALVDTEVKDHGSLRRVLDKAKGGGGTELQDAIPQAQRKMRRGTRYLIITDGETKWPDRLPPNSLVLLVNDKHPRKERTNWYAVPEHVLRVSVWITKQELLNGARKELTPRSTTGAELG